MNYKLYVIYLIYSLVVLIDVINIDQIRSLMIWFICRAARDKRYSSYCCKTIIFGATTKIASKLSYFWHKIKKIESWNSTPTYICYPLQKKMWMTNYSWVTSIECHLGNTLFLLIWNFEVSGSKKKKERILTRNVSFQAVYNSIGY